MHPLQPRPKRGLHRIVVATAAVALVTTAGLTATATTSGAAPKKATATVTKVSGVPKAVAPGATVKAAAAVRNLSRTKAVKKTVTFHLSQDARLDRKDTRQSAMGTGKLRPKARKTVRTSLKLASNLAPGTYHVLACIDGKGCKAARTVVQAPGPAVPDRGTLTGTLNFLRTTPFQEGESLDMHAAVNVAMSYTGPVTRPDELQSTGSTYSYTRNTKKEVTSGPCTTTTEDLGGGAGTLAEVADKYADEIFGSVALLDLSEISLTVMMRYSHAKVVTNKGDDTCDQSIDRGLPQGALHSTSMKLTQVSRTATAITYRATAWNDSDSTRSAWERIDGTLTLQLG